MILAIVILTLIILALIIKIVAMKKSVRKIRTDFVAHINGESNTLLSVFSRDKDICNLATEMNETLKEQRKMYLLYHEGNQEMKTAITNMSHDIRTPLTAISGYLELLKDEEKSESVDRYLSIIEERTAHMKKLTEEMFEYSIITSKEDEELVLEDVDLNRMLEDCVMNYYAALSEKKIALSVNITENKVVRKLDKMQVERVFSNLISNALKYSDGDLEISMDDEGKIVFANTAAKLSSVMVERLFGRFYTVEAARNSTGLGLSIAKNLVEKMNGKIEAEYHNPKLYIIVNFM